MSQRIALLSLVMYLCLRVHTAGAAASTPDLWRISIPSQASWSVDGTPLQPATGGRLNGFVSVRWNGAHLVAYGPLLQKDDDGHWVLITSSRPVRFRAEMMRHLNKNEFDMIKSAQVDGDAFSIHAPSLHVLLNAHTIDVP